MLYYLIRHNERQMLTDDPPPNAVVEAQVEADSWLAAKNALMLPLTWMQQGLLQSKKDVRG